jgi:hypothetical protein
LRSFKVNTFTKRLYSNILDKTFYINVSSTAFRTIRKYGSLDNYLLLSNEKLLDSMFGRWLRAVLNYKLKNPDFYPRKLPFTSKPRFRWKTRQDHEYKDQPSIFLPLEVRRTDISQSYYPPEFFETRVEKEKRIDLERKLENEIDPSKKEDIKKEMNLEKHFKDHQDQMLSLLPYRHKLIRDSFVKFRDRTNAKLHMIEILEKSENYAKLILGEKYRHYSEDYPEVQLILQQTEQEKLKKNKFLGKMYQEYPYEMGTYSETDVGKTFDPFKQKSGQYYSIEKTAKTLTDEKERGKKKDIKLKRKKVEKRRDEMRERQKGIVAPKIL